MQRKKRVWCVKECKECRTAEATHNALEAAHKEDESIEKKPLHPMVLEDNCKSLAVYVINRVPKNEIKLVAQKSIVKKWVTKTTKGVEVSEGSKHGEKKLSNQKARRQRKETGVKMQTGSDVAEKTKDHVKNVKAERSTKVCECIYCKYPLE
jgi:hypothetical protein